MALSASQTTTSSCAAWPCSCKASARTPAFPTPRHSSATAASVTINCSIVLNSKAPSACCPIRQGPNPIIAAPNRSSAWSSAIASWTRTAPWTWWPRNSASKATPSAPAASNGLWPITGYKKKLYALNSAHPPQFVQSQRTRRQQRRERADPKSLEQQVRQLLADKVSGNQIGIWLLVPERLRLGTWDLLSRWTDQPTPQLEPRLALHVVNEAALCLCSYRQGRSLAQKGFEAANGLPFVPSDQAIHEMLDRHTVQQSQQLQIALGKLRRAGKHFVGRLLAMDPHRMGSSSKRRMRLHRFSRLEKPGKMGQAFFLLDGDTGQPVCFTLLSSAQSVSEASPQLLRLAAEILPLPAEGKPLVLAGKEPYPQKLFAEVQAAEPLTCSAPFGLTPIVSAVGRASRRAALPSIGPVTPPPSNLTNSRRIQTGTIMNWYSATASSSRTGSTRASWPLRSAPKCPA